MRNWLRRRLAQSELFSFNVVRRDRWIAQQAELLPPGTKVLDVGAGSCPYRHLFSHCEYRTQDLAPLRDDQLRHGGYGRLDYVSDLAGIPVPDGSFGAVLCQRYWNIIRSQLPSCKNWQEFLSRAGDLFLLRH